MNIAQSRVFHRGRHYALLVIPECFLATLFVLVGCSQSGLPGSTNTGNGSGGVSGKTITTIVGTGAVGATGDNGPALSATLSGPYGISVDSLGYLYIADYGNSKIRVVNTSHTIFTAAGTGTSGYNGDSIAPSTAKLYWPTAVAVDASGNIYIADQWNDRVREVTSTITTYAGTGTPTYNGDNILATAAALSFPTGVCLDKSGNLYIADQSNHRVRLVTVGTGKISTVAGTGVSGYTGDGHAATLAELTSPYGVVLDSAGNLYISDPTVNVVRKVDTSGNITTFAGTGTASYTGDGAAATNATLHYPTALAVDSSGNLYIADSYNNVIRMVNTSGTISTVAGNGTPGFSPDGTLATSAELILPAGVAIDSSGNLYIADTGNNVIRVVK